MGKDILVGYTGFVGSNIALARDFDGLFNSKNIERAFGLNPDLLIYSGVPSAMYLANNFPEKDKEVIENAKINIKKINPKVTVLISTIAVYDNPVGADENTVIDSEKISAYGKNRLNFENFVENRGKNYLILRLPALYGKNIKKNFIYDYINLIPPLLTYEKFDELTAKDDFIKDFYFRENNGYYKCCEINDNNRNVLKQYFKNIGFSALNFTDSRSVYQFYNLSNLGEHIEKALSLGIKKLNLATEPVSVKELYKYLCGEDFENELDKPPFNYDYRTIYADKFGGRNGYIFDKQTVMKDIKEFVIGQDI